MKKRKKEKNPRPIAGSPTPSHQNALHKSAPHPLSFFLSFVVFFFYLFSRNPEAVSRSDPQLWSSSILVEPPAEPEKVSHHIIAHSRCPLATFSAQTTTTSRIQSGAARSEARRRDRGCNCVRGGRRDWRMSPEQKEKKRKRKRPLMRGEWSVMTGGQEETGPPAEENQLRPGLGRYLHPGGGAADSEIMAELTSIVGQHLPPPPPGSDTLWRA